MRVEDLVEFLDVIFDSGSVFSEEVWVRRFGESRLCYCLWLFVENS